VRDALSALLRSIALHAQPFPLPQASSEDRPSGACLILDVRLPALDGLGLRSPADELGVIRKRYQSLTGREHQVMDLVTRGLLNKQIATELGVSEITVKVHRRHVMLKMQVASLAELVRIDEKLAAAG